jgi:peptidyl-tRNA hydrolase, PTH2 family
MAAKLSLVVRTDLGMGRGKLAAQVAHAAVTAVLAAQLTADGSADLAGWLAGWLADGQPKVVLRVRSGAELGELAATAKAAGLPAQVITDAGRTQLAPGTATCCAIGPADAARVDAVTGGLALL